MADPLSITASIVAVLQLTSTVVAYMRDVSDSSGTKNSVMLEISATKGILETLKDLANDDQVLANIELLAEPLKAYGLLLHELETALAPVSGLRKLGKSLKWPFEKKEVLERLATLERYKTLFGLALNADHMEISRAVTEQVKELRLHQRDAEFRDVLHWLSPLDFQSKHEAIHSKHEVGTGQWLLDNAIFKGWEAGSSRLLWCPGVPGAGKTIFASLVVEHLTKRFQTDDIAVLGIYCDYKEFNQQSTSKYLASLLQQLIGQRGSLPDQVRSAFRVHSRKQTYPSFPEYLDMVTTQISALKQVYVVIDALDECTEANGVREELLEGVLQLPSFVKVMVTSRYIPGIEESFRSASRLDISAHEDDVQRHVRSRLVKEKTWARRIRLDTALAQKISASVVERASGMFLLAQLHITSVTRKHSRKDVERALKQLPEGLSSTYEQILQRIDDQGEEDARLAREVLSWLTYARRPLLSTTLQQALAIRSQDSDFDEDALIHEETLLDVCAGLVVLNQNTRVIHFVHYTTQEYFISARKNALPDSPLNIITPCLTFLLFTEVTKESMGEFYNYVADNWGHHARESPETPQLVEKIVAFVSDESRLRHCVQHMSGSPSVNRSSTLMSSLHIAARFDLVLTMAKLLATDPSHVNAQDDQGRTPLYHAAAAEDGNVVKLLLDRQDVDSDLPSYFHGPPLHSAIESQQEDIVQVLLARGVDIESKDSLGQRPVHKAIKLGLVRTLQALSDRGVDWTAETHNAHTPIELAMPLDSKLRAKTVSGIWRAREVTADAGGYTPGLKVILDSVTLEQINRGSMLFYAVRDGRPDLVEYFLAKGADPSAQWATSKQRTPLHWAAEKGFNKIIDILLKHGSDPVVQDLRGFQPLHYSAVAGKFDVAELLVPKMSDLDVKANNGLTAVQVAKLQGHNDITRILIQAGALDTNVPQDYQADLDGIERRHKANAGKSSRSTPDGQLRTLSGKSLSSAEYTRYSERLLTAAGLGDIEGVLLSLSKGVSVGERDHEHNKTALHWAAENGHADIAQLLLDWGSELACQDQYGETPLHYAAESGHADIVTAVCQAIDAQTIYSSSAFAILDDAGRTPLRCARNNYHTSTVKVLLPSWNGPPAEAEELDAQGKSLAHWAAELADTAMCKRLSQIGLSQTTVGVKDARGLSPIDYARMHNAVELSSIMQALEIVQ